MRKIKTILLLSLLCATTIFAQSYQNERGHTHLWGEANLEDLQNEPYSEWYEKNYQDHTPNISTDHASLLQDTKVTIYLGTWCGDTKYLLPRFVKSWEHLGLPLANLEFIALHNETEHYKQGPNGETEGECIHRVPTFVFERDGQEIGRIVERSVFDIDTDIMAIATGAPYEERYQAVRIMSAYMDTVNLDSLHTRSTINESWRLVRREVAGRGELNTYARMLTAQNKLQEALHIFALNRYLFRFDPGARDSYAEALLEAGELEQAKSEFLESIRIHPDNDEAYSQLAEVNRLLAAEEEAKEKSDG